MAFRILGPVEAYCGDEAVPLGGAKPRALLASLLLEHDRIISTSRLVDIVWDSQPPESARGLIQTYISTLRHSFAAFGHHDLITRQSPGYIVRLRTATLDRDVFEAEIRQAREFAGNGSADKAVESFRNAEGLWRGNALTGMEHPALLAEARRLDEIRMSIVEERIATELTLGAHDRLVGELSALVGLHPANERLRGQLMLALFRLGRQADALACYREGREALVTELGVEPGMELSALHSAILRGDPQLSLPAPSLTLSVAAACPAQLPAPPADFTGREQMVGSILDSLPCSYVISGPGGSGKSALAAHVSRLAAPSFPDGQLYAELHGMGDAPAQPSEVLGRFLRALGCEPGQIPESGDERAELYRTMLAQRRILILLDDAESEAQVRQLLPGSATCAVLITARDRLIGLAGTMRSELDVLPHTEALELLDCIVGDDRVASDTAAADTIVSRCGHLPLAIRIAGARLASRRQLPLHILATRLADEHQRLNELSAGDLGVRTSIGLSYRALEPNAQTALRLLGFLGVPDVSAWLVGNLLEVPSATAEALLEQLVDAQLVEFQGVDRVGLLRYRMHDLVKLFAREQAVECDAAERLKAAVARVLGGWLGIIDRLALESPPAEIQWRQYASAYEVQVPEGVADAILADPQAWLEGEQASMVVAVERAAALGLHQLACEFGSAQRPVEFEGATRFEFRKRIVTAALAATRLATERQGEAIMLAELARLRFDEDLYAESRQYFGEALSRFRELGDVRGQAASLAGLGIACREPGFLAEAVHFLAQAAVLLDALRDDAGSGYVLRLSGSVRLEQGDFPGALSDLEQAAAAYQRVSSRRGIAYTLRTLGLYHRALGEYEEALKLCTKSSEIFGELGDELMYAYAERAIAKAKVRVGRGDEALPRLEWVLSVAQQAGDRWGQANALRVLGQLHFTANRWELAENCLEAALSLWDAVEIPLWRARTRHDLSLLYRARGDEAAADAAFSNALKVFHDHGAREFKELSRVS